MREVRSSSVVVESGRYDDVGECIGRREEQERWEGSNNK